MYCLLWVAWGVLAYLASVNSFLPGDLSTTRWVQSFQSARMDALMTGVSVLGNPISVAIQVAVIAGTFLLTGRRKAALLVLLIPAIILTNDGLQWVIGRPRPSPTMVVQLIETNSGSFPSGHVVWATALVVCLLLLVKAKQQRYLRLAFWTLLVAFALLTGLSRIYLGAHWLSDVIGGYGFGALSAVGLFTLCQWWREPRFLKDRVRQ